MPNDIGNKIAQEKQLNEIYAQRLNMMKEIALLKQQFGINDIALNVTQVPETSSSERRNSIQNKVNNNNNNSSSCCICDRDCIIPICKMIIKVIAIVITPIVLFIVCIMANIATLVYLVTIGLWCIYLANGKGEDFMMLLINIFYIHGNGFVMLLKILKECRKDFD